MVAHRASKFPSFSNSGSFSFANHQDSLSTRPAPRLNKRCGVNLHRQVPPRPISTRLTIDNGLFVAEPHKEVAREAMLDAFGEYTGGFVARIS